LYYRSLGGSDGCVLSCLYYRSLGGSDGCVLFCLYYRSLGGSEVGQCVRVNTMSACYHLNSLLQKKTWES
jgi:hypothetical protein